MLTRFVTQPLLNLLIVFSAALPGNNLWVGIAILTILVRIILLPSFYKAYKSQRRISGLAGKVEELKAKHKDDQKLMSEELMKLYRTEGVNPLSSCLPLIIQFPILIGLYQAVRIGLTGEGLQLLYPFVPQPGPLNPFFLGIDLGQIDRIYLPIVAGLLTYVQIKQAAPKTQSTDPAAGMTKQMQYIFPVMTVVFAASVPAALPLYWAVSNTFSIVQQYWFSRMFPPIELDVHAHQHKSEKGKAGVEIIVREKGSDKPNVYTND